MLDVEEVIDVLVNEKGIPATVNENTVYLLHWTIPDEDGMVGASRISIHLFKTLKSVAEYLVTEIGIDSIEGFRNNFQNDGEENSYVWDVFVIEVED